MATPYLVLLATGALLLASRRGLPVPFSAEALSRVHRWAGLALPTLVFLVFWGGDKRVLLRNAREALTWRGSDLLWLLIAPFSLLFGRPRLPRAGKFNAGQKLHLLAQMILVPVFVASGAVMLFEGESLAAWLVHVVGFFVALPLVAGHLFLALIHPATRRGLPGMFTGLVDARWARHHHPDEYGEEP